MTVDQPSGVAPEAGPRPVRKPADEAVRGGDASAPGDRPAADVAARGAARGAEEHGEVRPFPEFLDLEREVSVFLRRARAASGVLAREVHPELEAAAYGLMLRLEDSGAQRATDLAAYFGVGKATMSRQLRALEALGLIARTPDPADGRASLVQLTEEGRTRFTVVRRARRQRYVRKLSAWDRGEVAELARLLHQFNLKSPPD